MKVILDYDPVDKRPYSAEFVGWRSVPPHQADLSQNEKCFCNNYAYLLLVIADGIQTNQHQFKDSQPEIIMTPDLEQVLDAIQQELTKTMLAPKKVPVGLLDVDLATMRN